MAILAVSAKGPIIIWVWHMKDGAHSSPMIRKRFPFESWFTKEVLQSGIRNHNALHHSQALSSKRFIQNFVYIFLQNLIQQSFKNFYRFYLNYANYLMQAGYYGYDIRFCEVVKFHSFGWSSRSGSSCSKHR